MAGKPRAGGPAERMDVDAHAAPLVLVPDTSTLEKAPEEHSCRIPVRGEWAVLRREKDEIARVRHSSG